MKLNCHWLLAVACICFLLDARAEDRPHILFMTRDNGMPFPYAKANCNEYGVHMPLAVAKCKRESDRPDLLRAATSPFKSN